jgi:hypothetical protein
MNDDTLALAVMDDDGYGCAITGMPAVNAYETAISRMEAARSGYREARREAERILREAGAEFEAAEDNLIRYESKRGIPLPEYRRPFTLTKEGS